MLLSKNTEATILGEETSKNIKKKEDALKNIVNGFASGGDAKPLTDAELDALVAKMAAEEAAAAQEATN